MSDTQETPALFKKEIKFPASIGDWTTYRPTRDRAKKIKPLAHGSYSISMEELEQTLRVHYFFMFELAAYLKEAIKASMDIFSISIEQLPYLDFLKNVTGGLIYNKLPISGIGEVFFLIDFQLANVAINFSLGSQSVDTKITELTELEESIIHSVFGNVLDKYSSCWKNVFAPPPLEIVSHPNIQRETHINLNEIITAISARISIANSAPATLTFLYQNSTLKKLNELFSRAEGTAPLKFSVLTDEILSSIDVPVVARLGSTRLAAKELTGIEDEDVISLDQKIDAPIDVIIGYASQLKSQPGTKNDRFAVKMLGGGLKKIRTEPTAALESEESPPKEEDMELPLETEEKEEYNEAAEGLFDEEQEKTEP